jgi:hypothetical protein
MFAQASAPVQLSLPVKGLQRLETMNHQRDFVFIVGDRRYECPSLVAEFLSPRVTSLRSQDITIQEFSITTEDPSHSFERLLSLGFGYELSVSEREMRFIRSVCGELWNFDLFEITLKNADGRVSQEDLKVWLEFLSGPDAKCDYAVPVVAAHFYDFAASDFDQMSPPSLQAVLSHSGLVLQDEDSVFEVIHRRASEDLSYFGLLEFVRFEFLSMECMKTAVEFISNSFDSITFGIWSSLRARLALTVTPPARTARFKALPAIDSKIISVVPRIFSPFRGKTLRLLYRGSRDGFQASAFHSRCNGHANTVSLISSTNGCIFGGYSPLPWSSEKTSVSDPNLKSFIFTIKNPHDLPAQIFEQVQEMHAIRNGASYGPTFGGAPDLYVCDQSRTSTSSASKIGTTYANNTGIAGNQVLTGAQNFTVEEIEVFEAI